MKYILDNIFHNFTSSLLVIGPICHLKKSITWRKVPFVQILKCCSSFYFFAETAPIKICEAFEAPINNLPIA